MKRVAAIFMILLFTALAGCSQKLPDSTPDKVQTAPTQNDNKNPSETEDINGTQIPSSAVNARQNKELVKKPFKTKYLLSNGIEIKHPEKKISTSKGEISVYLPQISCLMDKTLEDSLNKSIEKDIETEVKNYVIEKNERPETIACIVELNANNLLSISIRDFYSGPIYGFLYRLTDGKKLFLEDIFTRGTDYISLINQKVIEGIVSGKSSEEENILREPFSTIKPDQNFALSESSLYIVFHAGESGFVRRNSVAIPLSDIDAYVDVTDRYSGTERKTQEKADLIVRKNNIFITQKGEIIKKDQGNIWTYYPNISGLRDSAFEKIINDTINSSIKEAANSSYLDSFAKNSDKQSDHFAVIQMQTIFNHYGILCINRYVYKNEDMSQELPELNTVYTFDLINKKVIDAKDLFDNYIKKNNSAGENFASLLRQSLRSSYYSGSADFINEINSKLNYSFIMQNTTIYFRKYITEDDTQINVRFKKNTFTKNPDMIECQIPLKRVINAPPEDFFGW